MTTGLGVVVLAVADSINPVAIGMVLEALLARRAVRQAALFTVTTLVINSIAAGLLVRGFNLISGLQQSSWPAVLIVLAGVALLAQGAYEAVRARRHPDVRTRLWFSIADAGAARTIAIAAVVNIALLPFSGQMVVAMLQVSAMHGSPVTEWGWALLYSVVFTVPLWLLIVLGRTPLSEWRPRSAAVNRYGAPVASMFFGLGLIAIGLLS